jgi:hypothetical protein
MKQHLPDIPTWQIKNAHRLRMDGNEIPSCASAMKVLKKSTVRFGTRTHT